MPSQHVLTQEEWVAAMAKRAMDRIRSELYLDLRYMNAGPGCAGAHPCRGAAQPCHGRRGFVL